MDLAVNTFGHGAQHRLISAKRRSPRLFRFNDASDTRDGESAFRQAFYVMPRLWHINATDDRQTMLSGVTRISMIRSGSPQSSADTLANILQRHIGQPRVNIIFQSAVHASDD